MSGACSFLDINIETTMVKMITKQGLTIKHNVRAMMYFERATEKNFSIKD